MISSMTGFAVASREIPGGRLSLEIKSVNHRYLEFLCRLPEELRPLESGLREAVAAKLTRGKVDCRIAYAAVTSAESIAPNAAALAALRDSEQQILHKFPGARPMTVWEILHAPGVTADSTLTPELVRETLSAMLLAALGDLNATRLREGEKLSALIVERLDRIEELVKQITPFIPQLVEAYQQKLKTKLNEAMHAATDERISQEVVLFASRIDVAEELNRLSTHVSEVRRVLKAGGGTSGAGKRLDFLMQELNREANTIGSKSAAVEVTKISVELKVLIEQMREQIQNIE